MPHRFCRSLTVPNVSYTLYLLHVSNKVIMLNPVEKCFTINDVQKKNPTFKFQNNQRSNNFQNLSVERQSITKQRSSCLASESRYIEIVYACVVFAFHHPAVSADFICVKTASTASFLVNHALKNVLKYLKPTESLFLSMVFLVQSVLYL